MQLDLYNLIAQRQAECGIIGTYQSQTLNKKWPRKQSQCVSFFQRTYELRLNAAATSTGANMGADLNPSQASANVKVCNSLIYYASTNGSIHSPAACVKTRKLPEMNACSSATPRILKKTVLRRSINTRVVWRASVSSFHNGAVGM